MSRMVQFDAHGRFVRSFIGAYRECLALRSIWVKQIPYGRCVIECGR